MSTADSELLSHTCTVNTRVQKRTLNFDAGTLIFIVTDTITGVTSHATAVIESVTYTIGSSVGSMILIDVSGLFVNNETITSLNGAAVVNGVDTPYVNEDMEPAYYDNITGPFKCRFYESNYNDNPEEKGHQYFNEANPKMPIVVLPPNVVVERYTTTVTTTVIGFAGTYGVVDVKARYDEITLDHYAVLLTKEL